VSLKKRFKEKERHQSHNFKEGWIEFMDKRVARSVADMLNAQNIGQSHSFLFEARRKELTRNLVLLAFFLLSSFV